MKAAAIAALLAVACSRLVSADSPTPGNDDLFARAATAARGAYPRWASRQQTYWTVFGVDGGTADGLMNADGMVEVAERAWSLEPFVVVGDRWVTWADVETSQTLADGALPVPSVTWRHADFTLEVTAFAAGDATDPTAYVRYRLAPVAGPTKPIRLRVAARPLQVLPPWQDLNVTGGVGSLPALALDGGTLEAGARRATVVPAPSGLGVLPLESPEMGSRVLDFRMPSGAHELTVDVALPLREGGSPPVLPKDAAAAHVAVERRLAETVASWRRRLGKPRLVLPAAAGDLGRAATATLGYTLVHRDGPALQPGSRNYERSWIRDGALTSSMLLAFGHPEPVREYLLWYAGFQYPDGKIPCVIDRRGADPTPEHDSDGEFIYAVDEYWRFTNDRATLEKLWPHVRAAAEHIETLRAARLEARFRDTATYGLLPESISHEGYHRRPVHSYWDDFFALRGLGGAAELARVMSDEAAYTRFARAGADFRRDLRASLARVITERKIDYVPGSVELADFDPTSTAIAVTVAGAADVPPRAALDHTFERYRDEIVRWRAGAPSRDGFTPYEARNAEALVRLGRRDHALDVLGFVMAGRRPAGWQEWAEVVWTDPDAPRFVGDMPHTWAAQAVVQTLRTMLVYERPSDGALVLAAGVPRAWLDDPAGVTVEGMPTHAGALAYRLRRSAGGGVRLEVDAGPTLPAAGLVLAPPVGPVRRVSVNGKPQSAEPGGSVLVGHLPVVVTWEAP